MNDLLEHHDLRLKLNTTSLELSTSVLFCMTITYVDFYSEFNKLLTNPYDELQQHILDNNNNHNMYSVKGGMAGLSYSEFIAFDDFNLLRAGKKLVPPESKIIYDGEECILGKYVGFKNNIDIKYSPLLLLSPCCFKYIFSTYVQKDCENNYTSFTTYKKNSSTY